MKKLENMEDLQNDLDYFFSTRKTPGRIIYLFLNILILIVFFLFFTRGREVGNTSESLTRYEKPKESGQ